MSGPQFTIGDDASAPIELPNDQFLMPSISDRTASQNVYTETTQRLAWLDFGKAIQWPRPWFHTGIRSEPIQGS